MSDRPSHPLTHLHDFPLMQALFGRRARRFGLGMKLPSGPLAFESREEPHPLSKLEKALLIAAGTGVSGWNFGVPFGPARPSEHGQFTQRFTGRTTPTAAGIGTPVLFHTDDEGTWLTSSRPRLGTSTRSTTTPTSSPAPTSRHTLITWKGGTTNDPAPESARSDVRA